jgi:hypothetical protein
MKSRTVIVRQKTIFCPLILILSFVPSDNRYHQLLFTSKDIFSRIPIFNREKITKKVVAVNLLDCQIPILYIKGFYKPNDH